MSRAPVLDGFQFHDEGIPDKKVGTRVTLQDASAETNGHVGLGIELQTAIRKRNFKRLLVDGLGESTANFTVDFANNPEHAICHGFDGIFEAK